MTAVRPPRSWELQTAAVMAAVAAAALFGIVLFVRDLALRDYVLSGGVDGLSPWVAGLVLHGDAFDLLFFVVLFGYIFGFGLWRRETQRMLETIGDTRTPVTVHWTVVAWNLVIAAALMIRLTAEHSGDAAADLTVDAVQTGVRLVGIGCLLIGVWQIREQVLLRVAEAGIHLRHDQPRPSSMPVRTLLPAVTGEAPAADEDFWARVARAATGLREDLALLEKTGPLAYRWLLVPADGDLTAVRAELAPARRSPSSWSHRPPPRLSITLRSRPRPTRDSSRTRPARSPASPSPRGACRHSSPGRARPAAGRSTHSPTRER